MAIGVNVYGQSATTFRDELLDIWPPSARTSQDGGIIEVGDTKGDLVPGVIVSTSQNAPILPEHIDDAVKSTTKLE